MKTPGTRENGTDDEDSGGDNAINGTPPRGLRAARGCNEDRDSVAEGGRAPNQITSIPFHIVLT